MRELLEFLAAHAGFSGMIQWDSSKSDGTPKKQLDVSRLAGLGLRARIPWQRVWRAQWLCSQSS